MASEDRYYYITHSSSQRQLPEVMKWNENFTLAVEENVDYRQVIDLSINKLKQKSISKPVSDKYTKVKPVIKEIFLNHYTLTLKFIHETDIDDGEFYLFENSSDWYVVEYYSKNEKDRCKIEIDFRDKCLFQTMDKSALKELTTMLCCKTPQRQKMMVYLASIMEEKRKVT